MPSSSKDRQFAVVYQVAGIVPETEIPQQFNEEPQAVTLGYFDTRSWFTTQTGPQPKGLGVRLDTIDPVDPLDRKKARYTRVAQSVLGLLDYWDDVMVVQQEQAVLSSYTLGEAIVETFLKQSERSTFPNPVRGAARKSIYALYDPQTWEYDFERLHERARIWEAADESAVATVIAGGVLIAKNGGHVFLGTAEAALSIF